GERLPAVRAVEHAVADAGPRAQVRRVDDDAREGLRLHGIGGERDRGLRHEDREQRRGHHGDDAMGPRHFEAHVESSMFTLVSLFWSKIARGWAAGFWPFTLLGRVKIAAVV